MKPIKILLTVVISIAVIISGHSQTAKIDSLQKLLKTAKEDTNNVKILNDLSLIISCNDIQKALLYTNKALKLAIKLDYEKGISICYFNFGSINICSHNFDKALVYYFKSVQLCRKTNNKPYIRRCYYDIGNIYNYQGKFKKSIAYFLKSAEISKEINNKMDIIKVYIHVGLLYESKAEYKKALLYFIRALKISEKENYKECMTVAYQNIGNVYQVMGNNDKALLYCFKSLKLKKELKNKEGIGSAYYNIGQVYYDMGNYDKAFIYFSKSLRVREEMNDKRGISYCYITIGSICHCQKKYSEALSYFMKSLKINENINDMQVILCCYINIGETYAIQKNYTDALKYYNKALELAKKTEYRDYIKSCYNSLSCVYSEIKNYEKAYEYYILYSQYKDSISGEEVKKQFNELNVKYETELKDKENKLLKKDNEVKNEKLYRKTIQNIWLIIGSCLLFLIAFVIYRSYRIKKRDNTIISAEKQRSDMLLLNILPAETAEELKSHGKASAKDYDMVTVLFTDFKGFTMLAEKLTPAQLVNEIDYCFKEFDKIIMRYRIEKIKTIGDAYMCAGGLPSANETNPVDIVSAGLEIQHFMETYKKDRQSKGEVFFEIRIGIHTGPVVAGVVGIKKFAYDIWGDTVNIASRMESSGEVGKVNISGTTYEFVKDKFACTHRGKIEAKNKGMIDMYFVNNEQ